MNENFHVAVRKVRFSPLAVTFVPFARTFRKCKKVFFQYVKFRFRLYKIKYIFYVKCLSVLKVSKILSNSSLFKKLQYFRCFPAHQHQHLREVYFYTLEFLHFLCQLLCVRRYQLQLTRKMYQICTVSYEICNLKLFSFFITKKIIFILSF